MSSYSSINGRLKSTPDDFIVIENKGPIIFWGHENHVNRVKTILNKPCCRDGKTIADNMVKAVEWGNALFDLDYVIQIDILLVPDAYNYQYVTRYRIKGKRARVRFAFHYYDERPVTEAQFVKFTVDTLTHELAHVYLQLSDRPAKNVISDETMASVVGVCTRTLITQKIPIPTTGVLPKKTTMQEISASADHNYRGTVNQLRESLQKNGTQAGNSYATIMGGILAELIAVKLNKEYGHSGQLAPRKMREFCQHIVKTRHDFTMSMGFE